MKKIIPQLFFFLIFSVHSFASPNKLEYVNDGAVVAQVSSFTESGFLNCEFQCYLDMNYVDFEVQPTIFFQVGSAENPTAYKNILLNKKNLASLKIDQVFNEESYKLKINFGEIKVRSGFKARLLVIHNGEEKYIHLNPTSFQNEITKMNDENDSDLCKAEQFLKKIDFKNLYNNMSAL